MVIELRVVQFWSEIILVISNQTRAARSFDFEITRMISDQIALHSVQLLILTVHLALAGENERTRNRVNEPANQDEQLNDRVDSSFVCSSVRL